MDLIYVKIGIALTLMRPLYDQIYFLLFLIIQTSRLLSHSYIIIIECFGKYEATIKQN